MTVLLRPTLLKLKSYLQASGYFDSVTIGEPTDPPVGRHASIRLGDRRHTGTTLNGTLERRIVILRFMKKAFAGDVEGEDGEFWLDEAVSKIQEDLLGDFDLGSTIRAIFPMEMVTVVGFIDIGTSGGSAIKYRSADITVPLDIDDSAAYVA